jgi:hypothetical protein
MLAEVLEKGPPIYHSSSASRSSRKAGGANTAPAPLKYIRGISTAEYFDRADPRPINAGGDLVPGKIEDNYQVRMPEYLKRWKG